MLVKRLFSLFILVSLIAVNSAWAADGRTKVDLPTAQAAKAALPSLKGEQRDSEIQHPNAQQVVGDVTSNVLTVFRNDREKLVSDQNYLKSKVDELVVPYLDFKSMSILILSKKRWKAASEAQQTQFISEFKELLTNTYAQSLNRFSDETIELLPFEAHPKRPEKLAVVKSLVKLSSGSDIPLNYKLRYQESDGWKVYDIYVEGVSIVTSYRGSFASTLATQGLEGLIAQIKERNAKYKS